MAYRDDIQADSPIHYWPMDETSGTTMTALVGGVNGTYSNITLNQTGQVDGGAIQFNGTNARGSVALNLSAYSKIYVECLLYWPSYANDDRLAWEFTANGGTTNGGFVFDPNAAGGHMRAFHRGDVGSALTDVRRPAPARWTHIVVCNDYTVASNAENIVYHDGVSCAIVSNGGSNNASATVFANSTLNIGCRNGSSLFAPNGAKMQHLAIYSALSDSAIAAHAAAAGINPAVSFSTSDLHANVRNGTTDNPKWNALSILKVVSDCAFIRFSTVGSSAVTNRVYLRVNGSGVGQFTPAPGAYSKTSIGNGGTSRTYEIINGTQAGLGPTATSYSYVDTLECVGGTSTTIEAPSADTRIIMYGDSISVGTATTTPETDAPVSVLRTTYARNAIAEGWDGRAFWDNGSDATKRQAMADQIASDNPSYIYLQIGVNDYIRSLWTAANYQTAWADFLDKLHAAAPNATIIDQTMTVRTTETANGQGSTLPQYRTAKQNCWATRSWVYGVDGSTILTTSDLADSVHPTTAGAAILAAAMDDAIANAPAPDPGDSGGSRHQYRLGIGIGIGIGF